MRASPKSATQSQPETLTSRFEGLTSRCRIPAVRKVEGLGRLPAQLGGHPRRGKFQVKAGVGKRPRQSDRVKRERSPRWLSFACLIVGP